MSTVAVLDICFFLVGWAALVMLLLRQRLVAGFRWALLEDPSGGLAVHGFWGFSICCLVSRGMERNHNLRLLTSFHAGNMEVRIIRNRIRV